MNATNLTSRYLFNEIPDDQKKIDEFGHKACNLSLAKLTVIRLKTVNFQPILSHIHAAINMYGFTGNIGSAITYQKRHYRGYLVRVAQTP